MVLKVFKHINLIDSNSLGRDEDLPGIVIDLAAHVSSRRTGQMLLVDVRVQLGVSADRQRSDRFVEELIDPKA